MIDRSDEAGNDLEIAVEHLLDRLGLSFKPEPGEKDEPKLDFFVRWQTGHVWIEAKNRYDEKADNIQLGQSYMRAGYPQEHRSGKSDKIPDILTGVLRKVRDAYDQYEKQECYPP